MIRIVWCFWVVLLAAQRYASNDTFSCSGQFDGTERNLRPSELRGVERYTTGAVSE